MSTVGFEPLGIRLFSVGCKIPCVCVRVGRAQCACTSVILLVLFSYIATDGFKQSRSTTHHQCTSVDQKQHHLFSRGKCWNFNSKLYLLCAASNISFVSFVDTVMCSFFCWNGLWSICGSDFDSQTGVKLSSNQLWSGYLRAIPTCYLQHFTYWK